MKLHIDETSPTPSAKRQSSLFGKDRYKLFALAALLLLAVWSIFTGTLTLKSSNSDLVVSTFSFSSPEDFDVLEVAEREALVKKLWNVYLHGYGGPGNKIRLLRFWEEAFQAAFESLNSDSPAVRDCAFSEIAKMSLSSLDLLPTRTHPKDAAEEAGKTNSRKLKR
ncbi:hypothetical protein V2J09_007559 [Rumex salicifolius]